MFNVIAYMCLCAYVYVVRMYVLRCVIIVCVYKIINVCVCVCVCCLSLLLGGPARKQVHVSLNG